MKIVLGFAAMIGCTIAANLLLKLGAMPVRGGRLAFGLINWQISAGLITFACAAALYIWLLRVLPLNLAQCFAAAQFIGVVIASTAVLGEPISLRRWIGIALIALGILVVGVTAGGGLTVAAPSQAAGERHDAD